MRTVPADDDGVAAAAELLRTGGLVAFPTETVYGLGASALNAAAVSKIFAAKGRPADNPLIVHVASADDVERVAESLTPLSRELARRFWPGPLTLVLPARADLPRVVTAGLATVAVRVPRHRAALALLRAADLPVAAPSANASGRPSPTTAAHVEADLGASVDLVLDGGPTVMGVESTVVDARGDVPVVLREGGVTREDLGLPPAGPPASAGAAASPGTRHRHYTPSCTVVVAAPGEAVRTAALLAAGGRRVGLVATRAREAAGVVVLAEPVGAEQLGAVLYAALRAAEDAHVDVVVVEAVPDVGVGRAVMDRLRRAAAGTAPVPT